MSAVLPVRADDVPEELKRRRQWVGWCLEERDGKPTKVPYTPRSNRRASSTNMMTWGTFENALACLDRYDGIGLVFSSGDSYVGVDLDGCVASETDEIEPWATKIVEELNSYTEFSPSGTGLHIVVKGEIPGNGKKGHVEIYRRRGSLR